MANRVGSLRSNRVGATRRPSYVDGSRVRPTANRGRAVSWLILIGILIPAADTYFFLANAKMTAGRVSIFILLVPAVVKLCQANRRLLLCDFFALATGGWMLLSALLTTGWDGLGSAGAESIEFSGGYLAARAFIFGPAAVMTFVRSLTTISLIVLTFGVLDSLTGRLVAHNLVYPILNFPIPDTQLRTIGGITLVRAMSTFDHAILFGTFCAIVAAIMLYSQPSLVRKMSLFGLFGFGVLLSVTSGALMAVVIALGVYVYDSLMNRYSWRWPVLWTMLVVIGFVISASANHPLNAIVSHLTLDPETGYFRFLIWETAIAEISRSPIIGHGFALFGNLLDWTVDCVWLVFALRFGLPTVFFLLLTNLTAMMPVRSLPESRPDVSYIKQMSTAFSVALILFMFTGLTVHFWNYMWVFWGVCIGIRATLREQMLAASRQVAPASNRHGQRQIVPIHPAKIRKSGPMHA